MYQRPVGQAVKTAASHAANMGSIPVRVTILKSIFQLEKVLDIVTVLGIILTVGKTVRREKLEFSLLTFFSRRK